MNIMWKMDADAAMAFYERKAALGAVTEDECNAILCEMAREGLIEAITATNRSKEQIIEDLSKNWGTVLHLKPKDNETNSDTK